MYLCTYPSSSCQPCTLKHFFFVIELCHHSVWDVSGRFITPYSTLFMPPVQRPALSAQISNVMLYIYLKPAAHGWKVDNLRASLFYSMFRPQNYYTLLKDSTFSEALLRPGGPAIRPLVTITTGALASNRPP